MKNITKDFQNYILPICLIVILSFSRLIPHPWNFTPILAAGIFLGFYFKNFFISFFIIIFSMFLADIFIGFHKTMFFTYISLSLAVLLGLYIKKFKFVEIIFSGLISSICFFIITNFGAWMVLEMYEKNLSGLINSYILAIPFFHNTLISTLLYLLLLKIIFDSILSKKRLVRN